MRRFIFCICFMFLLQNESGVQALTIEKTNVTQQLHEMSVEEKIGQMLMIDFNQTVGSGQIGVNASIIRVIDQIQPGGIIFFKENIQSMEQTKRFTTELQHLNRGIPFFIGVDQEGGEIVNRLPFLTEMPGNMALGASSDLGLTKRVASVLGKELDSLGFNMNFAPVVDMNSNPLNPIVGVRSFGENPYLVAKMSAAFMEGLHEAGIVAVAKHFPGHGDITVDSHKGLPTVSKSIEQLKKNELIPYRYLIDNGLQSIMTAHIAFPAIEKSVYPASLSHAITTNLLRQSLGFNGVVITDALNMQAVASNFTAADAAISAVNAGADILLMPSEALTVKRALINAVKTEVISEERIDLSVLRILNLKAQLFKEHNTIDVIRAKEHLKVEKEAAEKGITIIKRDETLPIQKNERVAFIDDGSNHQSNKRLTEILVKAGITVTTEEEAERLIYILHHKKDALLNNNLQKEKKPIIVISTTTPYHYEQWDFVQGFIASFSQSKASIQAVSDYLRGELLATGCLPVSIYDSTGKVIVMNEEQCK
ncbi:glycoside hydrolase family 3 protein [Cytobacillus kochii]|uniref:glycoside hydrolase family 3 protein n=1 Tax=Cytobacillus kochii TaxID=859143 RepID=UPI00402AB0C6